MTQKPALTLGDYGEIRAWSVVFDDGSGGFGRRFSDIDRKQLFCAGKGACARQCSPFVLVVQKGHE
jgi:hypothetical protein